MKPLLTVGALALLFTPACKSSNPEVPRRAPVATVQSDPGPVIQEPRAAQPAAAEATPPAPIEAAAPARTEPVVARVAGEDVYVSELLATWMRVDSVGLRDLLENLVVERIIMQEARRIELSVDELRVGEAYTRALTEIENGLKESQPGVSMDEWVAGTLGIEPERYREGLELDVRRRLYAERVVRQFVLSRDWADVRVLVLEKRNEAEAALKRLEAGEPFARVAGEVSIDPSGKRGGQIPPVVRNDSALARLAFSTPEGEFGGPILEGKRWLVTETRGLHGPLVGPWPEVGPEVEASLAERPVEELEFMLWKAEMSARKPTDFEPLFELIRKEPE